ncbi:hypothetical protein EYF80_023142 [Liparis tanakae]|uniref:Uncharacterized protein n=1 Tax=Liparis tanakae TaxID=230148 RepID=A0A4Z2HL77_9TELE|nr:hypothetical protein EYF80_023142 [Liparis tanakae]
MPRGQKQQSMEKKARPRVREQVVRVVHAVGITVIVLRLGQQLPLQRGAGPNVHKGGLQIVFADQGVRVAPDGSRRVKGLQRAR